MAADQLSDKEKDENPKTGSPDAEVRLLLDQMKMKNDALKKIYAFFQKQKNDETQNNSEQ